jgi:hypothetical protein
VTYGKKLMTALVTADILVNETKLIIMVREVDADYSAIDRKNTDYDEGILISDVMTDLSINMTGILVGDVDGSYNA